MHDYRERLYVPLAWWLLAVPIVLIFGSTMFAGLPWPWPIVIFAVLGGGCVALLIAFGRGSVEIADGALRAGDAVLPLAAVSQVVTLDERQSKRLRGPRGDPAAHLYSRPYLKESVYVGVDTAAPAGNEGGDIAGRSGDGAAPYWLIGTRHPAELAAAIERCRVHEGQEPVA
jgi:Protein of unknown function (DUF3093)